MPECHYVLSGYEWLDQPLHRQLKWRLLLVDDYATAPISTPEPKSNGQKKGSKQHVTSKMEWILHLLKRFGGNIEPDFPAAHQNGQGNKAAVEDIIHKSLEKMEDETYDILLLDYLLGTRSARPEQINKDEREYGYEFLMELIESSKSNYSRYNRGPLGLYWIFPISSFPFALSDKLKQLGLNNFTELWHLSGGGDPVSTPYLFQYNLLDFMRQQVVGCLMDDDTLRTYLEPIFNIQILERWANAMNKKLEGLELKLLIIENESDGSYFADSIHHIASSEYYRSLILGLKELMEILQTGVRSYADYVEYKKRWDHFKTNYPGYPHTIGLIKEKLKDTVYKKVIEAARAVEQNKNKKRLGLNDVGLIILPKEISRLEDLEELYLNSNRLQFLPDWITQLRQLKKVHLRDNRFIEFPMELEKLEQLSFIDLAKNEMPEMSRKLAKSRPEVEEMIQEAKSISFDVQIQKKIIENLLKNQRYLDAVTQLQRITQRFKPDKSVFKLDDEDFDPDKWIQVQTKNILQKIHRVNQDYRSSIIDDNYHDAELKKIEYDIGFILRFFTSDSNLRHE